MIVQVKHPKKMLLEGKFYDAKACETSTFRKDYIRVFDERNEWHLYQKNRFTVIKHD